MLWLDTLRGGLAVLQKPSTYSGSATTGQNLPSPVFFVVTAVGGRGVRRTEGGVLHNGWLVGQSETPPSMGNRGTMRGQVHSAHQVRPFGDNRLASTPKVDPHKKAPTITGTKITAGKSHHVIKA